MNTAFDYYGKFFRHHQFTSSINLLTDAAAGGSASSFVTMLLNSRYKTEYRHSMDDVRAQLTSTNVKPWFNKFKHTVWSIYHSHNSLAYRKTLHEDPVLSSLTKRQGTTLRGTRTVQLDRKGQATHKEEHMCAFKSSLLTSVMQWGDNFAKFKY